MTARAHLIRSTIFLLVFLSPIGAPLVGILLASVCPTDMSFHPSGPFAMSFASCGISPQIEQLYQKAVFLPLTPFFWVGPVIGIPIAAIWIVAAGASAWMSARHLARAIRARSRD
jgi:hypothetical protein